MKKLNGGKITLYRKVAKTTEIKEVIIHKTFFDLSYFLEDVDVNYQLIVHYDNYSMMFRLYNDFFSVNLTDKILFLLEENSNGPNTFKPVLGSNIRPNKITLNQIEHYKKSNAIDVIPLVTLTLNDDEFFFLEVNSLVPSKPYYEIGVSEFGVFLDSNTNCLDIRGLKVNQSIDISKNSLGCMPNPYKENDHSHLLFQRIMHKLESKKYTHNIEELKSIKEKVSECFISGKPLVKYNENLDLVDLAVNSLVSVLGEYKNDWYLNQIIYSDVTKQYQLFFTYDLKTPKVAFIALSLEECVINA